MRSVKKKVREGWEALKADMKQRFTPGDLKGQLTALLAVFGHLASPENYTRTPEHDQVGKSTIWERKRLLVNFLDEVTTAGLHPQFLWNLGPRHVRVATEAWLAKGLTTGTIRNRLAAIHFLYALMGKADAKPKNALLMPRDRQRVPTYATRIKTWAENDIALDEVLKRVPAKDVYVADALRLQRAFGLRMRESLLIDVHESDRTILLWLHRGTKGKRPRWVPIETPEQRRLLDDLKARYAPGMALIGPESERSFRNASRRYYAVLRRVCGISKEEANVTGHGNRIGYLCDQYFRLTGERAPILGGKPVMRELDREARTYIAFIGGHFRGSVASRYLGRVLYGWRATPGEPKPAIKLTPEMAFVVRHQRELFAKYAVRKVEVDRLRAGQRVLPSAASRQPRRRRSWTRPLDPGIHGQSTLGTLEVRSPGRRSSTDTVERRGI